MWNVGCETQTWLSCSTNHSGRRGAMGTITGRRLDRFCSEPLHLRIIGDGFYSSLWRQCQLRRPPFGSDHRALCKSCFLNLWLPVILPLIFPGPWWIWWNSASSVWLWPRILAPSNPFIRCNVVFVSWKIVNQFATLHSGWYWWYFRRHERDSPYSCWCWGLLVWASFLSRSYWSITLYYRV